eukprot:gene47669-58400_t
MKSSSNLGDRKGLNKPLATFVRQTAGPARSGLADVQIEYRGVWGDFDQEVYSAKLRQSEAEVQLRQLAQEHELLQFEKTELELKFRATLASLTESSSSQQEVSQLLIQIRAEREALVGRVSALETHSSWLQEQVTKTEGQLSHWLTTCQARERDVQALQAQVKALMEQK